MTSRCSGCGSNQPANGRFCTSCGKVLQRAPQADAKDAPNRSLKDSKGAVAAAWVLVVVVAAFWMNQKSHGRLVDQAAESTHRFSQSLSNGGLDGRYVCVEMGIPMTITIDGGSGSMDLGVIKASRMRVERHGDTVSMSGGQAFDAQGGPIDEATRKAMSDGNDVDLLKVGDDGQSLTLHLGQGRTAKFVKQQ